MQRNRCLGVVVATSFIAQAAVAGDIDPNLQHVMDASRQGETISALVYLVDQVDLRGLNTMLSAQHATRHHRHETVVIALQDMAHATQGDLIAHIEELLVFGEVADYHAFWITNAVRVSGTPDAIRELSDRDDVEYIYLDYPIEGVQPVETFPDDGAIEQGGPEPGLLAINADDAWAAGYDGTGVLVSNIDTGVDGTHPALASRWAGLGDAYDGHPEWAWFDPHLDLNDFPYDDGSHGTHTMGTICGGQPGDAIGVAPGATWICAAAIDRPGASITVTAAHALASMQWKVPSVVRRRDAATCAG